MKAVVMISRVGQIIILAIVFMACVGWNQAAGLQNNITSLTHKRVKDIVRIRYILPYTNLHSVPNPCLASNTDNLNGQFGWENGSGDLGNQNASSCKTVFSQSVSFKQTKIGNVISNMEKTSQLTVSPFSCQTRQTVADTLQGKGYFSGFDNSAEATDFVSNTFQETFEEAPLASVNDSKRFASPYGLTWNYGNCTATMCHTKGNMFSANYSLQTPLFDANGIGDETLVDSASQSVVVGCQTK